MANPSIKAIIFDFDGVIADSFVAHYLAFKEVFGRIGIQLSKQEFLDIYGIGAFSVIKEILKRYDYHSEIAPLVLEKDMIYRRLFPKHVKPLPGALEFISGVKVPKAIASSTTRDNLIFAMKRWNLTGFEFYLAREDVARTKPDPEAYLLAIKKLGVPASSCIVIEDTSFGVSAAKAAGASVIGITTTFGREELAGADFIADDYKAIKEWLS
ncbi:MAG: HAD family phosphatase [Nanoarchaeota archaeon]|nr:HAD family phosphatase [Nanoarchaeota archaeon]